MAEIDKCQNCGLPRAQHVIVSYAGAVLMDTPFICPTAVFRALPPSAPPVEKGAE